MKKLYSVSGSDGDGYKSVMIYTEDIKSALVSCVEFDVTHVQCWDDKVMIVEKGGHFVDLEDLLDE